MAKSLTCDLCKDLQILCQNVLYMEWYALLPANTASYDLEGNTVWLLLAAIAASDLSDSPKRLTVQNGSLLNLIPRRTVQEPAELST